MTPGEVLRTVLVGASPSSALGARVYPVTAPQGASTPFAVYTQFPGQPSLTYDRQAEHRQASVELDIYASTAAQAWDVAAEVRARVVNHEGPVGGLVIQAFWLVNEVDLFEPEPGLYRVTQTFDIWYDEA